MRRRTLRQAAEAWPGYVDVLSTLVMVIVFLLVVFVLAQFFLGETLSGQTVTLKKLRAEVGNLAAQLSLERQANNALRVNVTELSSSLTGVTATRDKLQSQLAETQQQLAQASQNAANAKTKLSQLQSLYLSSQGKLSAESKRADAAAAQEALLNEQVAAVRQQLAEIAAALKVSEAKDTADKTIIEALGKKLNIALARKVQQLAAYRSEFFGELRKVLGDQKGIRIVGDRFVFQSEILFPTGSAQLTPQAQTELQKLAKTLLAIAPKIPTNLNWILRVDGHTDAAPIHTAQFPSNWDLSTARAVSVVKYLISQGVPPKRLAAAGFSKYHPLVQGNTPADYSLNRRIEFLLTTANG